MQQSSTSSPTSSWFKPTPWSELQNLMNDPKESDDVDRMDAVLADAMNQLSFQDREKVSRQLHGVWEDEDEREETPEFVAQQLALLQQELQATCQIANNTSLPTAALELAMQLSPTYVQNPKFLLPFLRTENFDISLAAQRIVRYFDLKFACFGGAKLCQDITWNDLDDDDVFALEAGFLQILPVRDRAGRPVCALFPDQQEYKPGCKDIALCFARMLFFYFDALKTDVNTAAATNSGGSRRGGGIVLVIYSATESINVDKMYPQIPPIFFKVRQALPIRVVSYHFCFQNSIFRLAIQYFLVAFGKGLNAITKAHQGSQQEIMYSLMTYGIPTDSFPVQFDNTLKRNHHLEMLRMIQTQQAYNAQHDGDTAMTPLCVVIPFVHDILLGKGAPLQSHAGNVRLKMTVDELLSMHANLDKDSKAELTVHVVKTVKETGGRFISKESGVWMVVADNVARERVATMFRNRKKIFQKQQRAKAAAAAKSSNGVAVVPTTVSSGKVPRQMSLDGNTIAPVSGHRDSKRLRN